MLGKLIKYEWKATSKLFFLMYAALIAISALNLLLNSISSGFGRGITATILTGAAGITMVANVLMIIAIFAVTVVIIILRFYKNLLGDEGYLMFTLPVSVNQHLISKLIVGTIYLVSSGLAVIISILILTARTSFLQGISDIFSQMASYGINPVLWTVVFIGTILLSFICTNLQFYCAMSVGPSILRNRLGGSVLAYVIIYTAEQILSLVLLFAFFNQATLGKLRTPLIDAANSNIPIDMFSDNVDGINYLLFLFVAYILAGVIITSVACFTISHHSLKNKLNLS